jgi:hypothetical protein
MSLIGALPLTRMGTAIGPEPQSTVVSGQFLFTMRCLFVAVLKPNEDKSYRDVGWRVYLDHRPSSGNGSGEPAEVRLAFELARLS